MSGATGSLTERLPIKHGIIAGAGAWIAGIAVSYVLASAAGGAGQGLALFGISTLDLSVIFYFTLHLWPAVLAPSSDVSVLLIFTPIAIAILLVAGYRVASKATNAESGFKNGATVTAGYAVLAVLSLLMVFGSFADLVFQEATGFVLVSLVFTGLLMPVVFGGLGGWIADKRAG